MSGKIDRLPRTSMESAVKTVTAKFEGLGFALTPLASLALESDPRSHQKIYSVPGGIASPWGVQALMDGVKREVLAGSKSIQLIAMFHGTVGTNPTIYPENLDPELLGDVQNQVVAQSRVKNFHGPNAPFGDSGFEQMEERCCGAGAEDEFTTRRQVINSLKNLNEQLRTLRALGLKVNITVIEAQAKKNGEYGYRIFGDTTGMSDLLRGKVDTFGENFINIEAQGDNPYYTNKNGYRQVASVDYDSGKLATVGELNAWIGALKDSGESIVGVACSDPRQALLVQSDKGISPDSVSQEIIDQVKDDVSRRRRKYKSSRLPQVTRDLWYGVEAKKGHFSNNFVNNGHGEPAALVVDKKTAKVAAALALQPMIVARRKHLGLPMTVAPALPFLINVPQEWWGNPEYQGFFKGVDNLLSVLNTTEFRKGKIGKGRQIFVENNGKVYAVTAKGGKGRIRGLPIICSKEMKAKVKRAINPGMAYNIGSVDMNALGTTRPEKTFRRMQHHQFDSRTSPAYDDSFGETEVRSDILLGTPVRVQVPRRTVRRDRLYAAIQTQVAFRNSQFVVIE